MKKVAKVSLVGRGARSLSGVEVSFS